MGTRLLLIIIPPKHNSKAISQAQNVPTMSRSLFCNWHNNAVFLCLCDLQQASVSSVGQVVRMQSVQTVLKCTLHIRDHSCIFTTNTEPLATLTHETTLVYSGTPKPMGQKEVSVIVGSFYFRGNVFLGWGKSAKCPHLIEGFHCMPNYTLFMCVCARHSPLWCLISRSTYFRSGA